MPGEPDPTAEPGATDTDANETDDQDPTQELAGATDTDDSTGDDASKKKGTPKPDATDDDGKDWEASYKGLQPKYQKLVEAEESWKDDRLKLGGQIAELETTVKTSAKTVETMLGDAKKAESATADMQKTIDGLEADGERSNLIMSKYPQLAVMESKGLLPPDLTGEELTEKLDSMSELLKEQGIDNTGAKILGSTGDDDLSTGHRSQGDDVESINQKLMEANATGDGKEAARLLPMLIEAQNKKFAAAGIGEVDLSQAD